MALTDELERIAGSAAEHAEEGEQLAAVLAAEPGPGERIYLCSYESPRERTWLALDGEGNPVTSRKRVREAASIAAMCEVSEESAGGGELDDLRAKLVALRLTEQPPGIEEAEAAALDLQRTIDAKPRLASPSYLETVGAATRRLERALGGPADSPFAIAMQQALGAVEELAKEIESEYKLPLT